MFKQAGADHQITVCGKLIFGCDVIGLLEIARVDVLDLHEFLKVQGLFCLKAHCTQLLLLQGDVAIFGDRIGLHDIFFVDWLTLDGHLVIDPLS